MESRRDQADWQTQGEAARVSNGSEFSHQPVLATGLSSGLGNLSLPYEDAFVQEDEPPSGKRQRMRYDSNAFKCYILVPMHHPIQWGYTDIPGLHLASSFSITS